MSAIIVPITTAVVALGAGWGGLLLGARNEGKHWLRQKRLDSYAAFLAAVESYTDAHDDHASPLTMHQTLATVLVLGPEEIVRPATDVATAAHALRNWLFRSDRSDQAARAELVDQLEAAFNPFWIAARRALG